MVRLLQAWRPFTRLFGGRALEAPGGARNERLEALVMSGLDHQRCTAMRRLSPLPRALFLLHNFYGVEIGAMAEEIGADRDTIDACLADARTIVRAHVCYTEPVPGMGAAAIELEARLQQDYRRSLAVAFTGSGYPGEMIWPNPAADIPTDQEAAAAFIVSRLTATLRNAVLRSRRAVSPRWINGALSDRGAGVGVVACFASTTRSAAQAGSRSMNGWPIAWFPIIATRTAMPSIIGDDAPCRRKGR